MSFVHDDREMKNGKVEYFKKFSAETALTMLQILVTDLDINIFAQAYSKVFIREYRLSIAALCKKEKSDVILHIPSKLILAQNVETIQSEMLQLYKMGTAMIVSPRAQESFIILEDLIISIQKLLYDVVC